jgi:hypothetical protein
VDVDIGAARSQDIGVSRMARVILIFLTMALLPWLGLVQALPHNHAGASVSQELSVCSTSGPNSTEVRLHHRGDLLPHHVCLACLASASHAAAPSQVKLDREEFAVRFPAERPHEGHSRSHAHLPLLRGPPVVA